MLLLILAAPSPANRMSSHYLIKIISVELDKVKEFQAKGLNLWCVGASDFIFNDFKYQIWQVFIYITLNVIGSYISSDFI